MVCLGAYGQPIMRNNFTTNTGPNFDGSGLTNLNPASLTGGNIIPAGATYSENAILDVLFGTTTYGYALPSLTSGKMYLLNILTNDNNNYNQIVDTNGNSYAVFPAGQQNGPVLFSVTNSTPGFYIMVANNPVSNPLDAQLGILGSPLLFNADLSGNNVYAVNYFGSGENLMGVVNPALPNNFSGQQTFSTNVLFKNANQYIFAGTITASAGSQTFTAASGTFSALFPGNYFICTNGGGGFDQYRIVKIRDSTHLNVDVPAARAYTAVHQTQVFPNTAQFYDLNGNYQGSISQDTTLSIQGITTDSTANSGRIEWNNGTNTVWANVYNDGSDTWMFFSTYNLGWDRNAPFKFQVMAPANSLVIDTNGFVIAGVGFKGSGAGITNLPAGVIITNFNLGQRYTNTSGFTETIISAWNIASMSTATTYELDLRSVGTMTNAWFITTGVTVTAQSQAFELSTVVTNGGWFTFTNVQNGTFACTGGVIKWP